MADNIQSRRGRKMEAKIPLFQDTHTSSISGQPQYKDVGTKSVVERDGVALDRYGYAFGVSAIQVTMQAKNLDEACRLHDQFSIMGPMMMALSAATPGHEGFLADTDVRWEVVRAIMDDRNAQEASKMVSSLISIFLFYFLYQSVLFGKINNPSSNL